MLLSLRSEKGIKCSSAAIFLEGTCEGRRGRGRPRRRWTQDIGEWMKVSTVEAGRQALERGEFRQAVWDTPSIKDPP